MQQQQQQHHAALNPAATEALLWMLHEMVVITLRSDKDTGLYLQSHLHLKPVTEAVASRFKILLHNADVELGTYFFLILILKKTNTMPNVLGLMHYRSGLSIWKVKSKTKNLGWIVYINNNFCLTAVHFLISFRGDLKLKEFKWRKNRERLNE